jgi:hypothetical protein
VYGARFGVRTNEPADLALLEERFPPKWRRIPNGVVDRLISVRFAAPPRRPGVRNYHLLYDGSVRLARTLERDELLGTFESYLHRLVAETSPKVFIHAGVVGWQGRAIVLPGRTLAGKTTLVAALMRAGAEYYSDEYAVVDREGMVHPYPKPLGMRQPESIKQTNHSAQELGGRVGRKSLPVGAVIVSRFREGATWRPRRLSAGRAVLALLEHCASAQRSPGDAVETAKKMVSSAVLLKGTRGEADELAPLLLRRL